MAMTNPPPQTHPRERPPAAPGGQRRQVATAAAKPTRRRGRLLLLSGLVLVLGSATGFWLVLRSIDERAEYLVASRTIERWEVAQASDFTVVEASIGDASALTLDQHEEVIDRWATGRIPQGTLITAGLFETPPLSSSDETDQVLLQVSLPSSEAPFKTLDPGDTVALLGSETFGPEGRPGPRHLIGVLRLEFVQEDDLYYIVSPDEAVDIMSIIDRFMAAANRKLLKLGHNVGSAELVDALNRSEADSPQPEVEGALPLPGADPVGRQ